MKSAGRQWPLQQRKSKKGIALSTNLYLLAANLSGRRD